MKKFFYFVTFHSIETKISNCNVELGYEIISIDDIFAIEKSISESNKVSDVVIMGYQLFRVEEG